ARRRGAGRGVRTREGTRTKDRGEPASISCAYCRAVSLPVCPALAGLRDTRCRKSILRARRGSGQTIFYLYVVSAFPPPLRLFSPELRRDLAEARSAKAGRRTTGRSG